MSLFIIVIALLSFLATTSLFTFVIPLLSPSVSSVAAILPQYTFIYSNSVLSLTPLIAIRRRIAYRDGRITYRRVLLIGPFEIGLGRRPIRHPQFTQGTRVVAFFPLHPHSRFVTVWEYLPRNQLYDVIHELLGHTIVPASSVYPVPYGAIWTQSLDGVLTVPNRD